MLSLRHFGWRDAAHYPLAGVGAADSGAVLLDRREPPIFLFSEFRCGPIDGARAVELFAATGSLHIGAGRQRTGRGAAALRHFRLANGVLYPLAGLAEESGAAHLDLRGPPGWGAGFLFGDIPVRGPPPELGRIGATDAAAAVELRGHRRQHPGSTTALKGDPSVPRTAAANDPLRHSATFAAIAIDSALRR